MILFVVIDHYLNLNSLYIIFDLFDYYVDEYYFDVLNSSHLNYLQMNVNDFYYLNDDEDDDYDDYDDYDDVYYYYLYYFSS